MPEAVSAGVSELPLLAICQECSLVSIWEPNADEDHPHERALGHELKIAGVGDLPSDEQIEVPGGGA